MGHSRARIIFESTFDLKVKWLLPDLPWLKFWTHWQENKLWSHATSVFEVNILPKSLDVFWGRLQGSPSATSPKYPSSLGGLHRNTCLFFAKIKDDQPSISNSISHAADGLWCSETVSFSSGITESKSTQQICRRKRRFFQPVCPFRQYL